MRQAEVNSIVDRKVVGTQLMTALQVKWPDTQFSFNQDKTEIAAWDAGKKKWMAICAISNLGLWTGANHLMQYVEGNATADQRQYPEVEE